MAVELEIEKLVTGAYGLARKEGRTILVPDALPGEIVSATEEGRRGGAYIYRNLGVLEKSEKRVVPACPYYGICGGCDFLFVSRRDSAFLKQEMIQDNLKRISGVNDTVFEDPVYTEIEGYRSRARVHISLQDKKIGFLTRSSSALCELDGCPILTERLNALIKDKSTLIKRARNLMFDNKVNRKTAFVEVALQDGDDEVSYDGRTISALGYLVNSSVFFQSNLYLLPSLLSFVHDNTVGDVVMDLYSGVGTFSRLFEGEGRTLYAVEKEKRCLDLSRRNAPSASSFTDDVAFFSRRVRRKVDTVIVDPPRVGLDSSVVEHLLSWSSERIIYVSCDSTTFCRDYSRLKERYDIVRARVFDFYPGSHHEESAYVLSLR